MDRTNPGLYSKTVSKVKFLCNQAARIFDCKVAQDYSKRVSS
jgi:hypothetical protein